MTGVGSMTTGTGQPLRPLIRLRQTPTYSIMHTRLDPGRGALFPEFSLGDCLKIVDMSTISLSDQSTKDRNFDMSFDRYNNLRTDGVKTADNGSSLLAHLPFSRESLISRLRNKSSSYSPLGILYRFYRRSQLKSWPVTRGERIRDRTISEIDRLSNSNPFFLWVHFMDLHAPIHPDVMGDDRAALSRGLLADTERVSDIESNRYHSLYDHAIRYVDDKIDDIIQDIRGRNLWESTIFALTSDHGEALFERGRYGHEYHDMYDELLHVPLLIRLPGSDGRRIQTPFSLGWLHDLFAEALDIDSAGAPLSGPDGSYLSADYANELVFADSMSEKCHSVTVRDQSTKLTRHFGTPLEADRLSSSEEAAYRYRYDPLDLYPLSPDVVPQELRTAAKTLEHDPYDLPNLKSGLGDDVETQLQNLGYKT